MTNILYVPLVLAAMAGEDGAVDTLSAKEMNEVSVVATIKEEGRMRQQPTSVSLIDNKEMMTNHITSLKATSSMVPNMFIPDYGSRLTSAIYLRGVGSRINTSAVGLYVDNIPYVNKSAFDFNFYDIERVDVMRGPQGTLYGRNTMGGLVRVYTKNPFNYEGSDVRLGYASCDNHYNISATHYHRLSDKFAFSGGGYYEGSRGFFQNDVTGEKVDGMKAGGTRLRGIVRPNDRLNLDLHFGYDYTDEGAYPYYYTGTLKGAEQFGGYVGKISNNRENRYRRGMLNSGLNLAYKTDTWQMNAVTGYQNLNDRMFIDQDFLQADIYTLEQKQRINTLNEEVTFKSVGRRKWEWLTGANVMYQWLNTQAPVVFYEDGVSSLIEDNTNRIFTQIKESYPKMPDMAIAVNNRIMPVNSDMDTPLFTSALFHQSSLNFGNWRLSLGARLEYGKMRLNYLANTELNYDFNITMYGKTMPYPGLVTAPCLQGKIKDDYLQVLPRVSVTYTLPSYLGNVYATVSKGYRGGGYNIQMISDLVQSEMRGGMMTTINEASHKMMQNYVDMDKMVVKADINDVKFKAEYSWNYEVGTHLSLCNHMLLLDVSAFYSRIYDQQIARFAPSGLGRMMVNAGKSESYGGELSLHWNPIKALQLGTDYGYTHATFLKYEDGTTDYAGNYVPFVPKHTLRFDAGYTWFFAGNSNASRSNDWCELKSLTLGADVSCTGNIYWTESNNVKQSLYSLLGAHLTVETRYFTLNLWGKNLTNKRYNSFYFESANRGFEQHGKPLQVGLDVRLHF